MSKLKIKTKNSLAKVHFWAGRKKGSGKYYFILALVSYLTPPLHPSPDIRGGDGGRVKKIQHNISKWFSEKMPEREQQPFNKFLESWPVEPFFIIERFTLADGFFNVAAQLLDNHFFAADENNFMHIAE